MRNSDRWITPGVVIVGILTVGGVVLGIAALVAYLTARGIDPDPMIRLVAQVATGASALGGFVLQLANRKTTAKTERNTGQLASAVDAVHDAVESIPARAGRMTAYLPPVPEGRHGAAPAVGEDRPR